MAGRREHIEFSLAATGIRATFYSLHQIVVDTNGNGISILIIIAEERCMVANILAHLLLTLPVLGHGFQNLVHRVLTLLEHMFLQRRETVGNRTETGTLDIGRVITGTATIVVLSLFDTVVDIEAEESGRGIEGEHALDVVIHREFQVHEIHHLLVPGLIEFLKGLERTRITRFKSQLLAGFRINTIIQGNLQDLRCVQITRQQIGLLTEGTHLDAA